MGTKLVLILALVTLCVWSVVPPEDKIRLGKDLRGGVSLVYQVQMPPDTTNRGDVVAQVIDVLKDRVNPKGIFDISITPLGLDRIEIVMPLPNEKVQGLQQDFQDSLKTLLTQAQILELELVNALEAGEAVSRYCADSTTSPRCGQIGDLQTAFDSMRDAEAALAAARDESADEQTIAERETAVATAEIDYEGKLDSVLNLSLDRGKVVRILGLSQEPVRQVDRATNKPVLDAAGDPIMLPSPRDDTLTALRAEYPTAADQIQSVVDSFDAYQEQRTGLDDPEDLKRLLQGAGVLHFRIAVRPTTPEGVNVADMRKQLDEVGPDNTDSTVAHWYPLNELKQWYDGDDQLAALEANPQSYFAARGFVVHVFQDEHYMLLYDLPAKRLSGAEGDWTISNTFPSVDQMGRPAVAFGLDNAGGALMGRMTGAHVGQPMAIVLDGQVYSAPTLQSQISSNGIITGSFSQQEINYLIRVLAAGSLSARLTEEPVAVNVLGPTLGAENLDHGLTAFKIAIIAVAVFMLAYYFFAGLVADLALLLNGIIIFGIMAMIDGTFTLPGLAGIVLTMGMAVDANVLIYERIREEIFGGDEDLRTAIRQGYAKALSTIIDANVTNLIVCFVLFYTATAEVRGFALTLTIGICATLFTALFVTRQVYYLYTDVFKVKKLEMLPTVVPSIHRALEPSINWVGMRKVFWVVSAIAIVGSLGLVSTRGVDMFDTEFRGGVSATMAMKTLDENNDGLPDRDQNDELIRQWMLQSHVESTLADLAATADPTSVSAPGEVLRERVKEELGKATIQTAGATREAADGGIEATAFQVKVANPKDLGSEDAITDIVVELIVGAFGDQIDISPPLSFDGRSETNPSEYVFPVEAEDLRQVVGRPGPPIAAQDFLGGAAILIGNIDPPVTTDEIAKRIEFMRNAPEPEFRNTAGRRTRVVGLTPADPSRPDDEQRDVVVLVAEPAMSSLLVESDVWFGKLAQPEWKLVTTGLERQSSLQQVASYSSAVAQTLSANAVVAVVLTLLGILLYIWVRFGSLRYSAAAIAALVHDVCIALGLLAASAVLAGGPLGNALGIEAFRIDLGVVAALLTIIGYSLNDTIVILDRIRENRGKRPLPTAEMVNRSINQTVSRTLLTSLTTLMAVLIMYSQGGSGIRPFTFCLLTGLVVGTYSSVAIAAPLVYERRASGRGTETPSEETTAAESVTPAGVA